MYFEHLGTGPALELSGSSRRPYAVGFVLSRGLMHQLARGGMLDVLTIGGSRQSSRDDPWPNSVCLGGSSGCYVETFFYLFNETSFLPFQRSVEGLTSCADESLLLTGQQAGTERAVWSSCSVNHSQKAQRKLKGNACE